MSGGLLLVIPAYNEEHTIAALLEALGACGATAYADVLIVNDASTDDTRGVVRRLGVPHVDSIFNLGYGSALQLGYKYAERHGYDYVIQMDADGQHDASNVAALYAVLISPEKPDIVIGSRFLPGSVSFPILGVKRFAIALFSALVRLLTGERVKDPTSGLQGLSRRAFTYYAGYSNFNSRYPDANMIVQMLLRGFTVREIPAVMHARSAGVSMHAGVIKPVLYMLSMTLSILAVAWREGKARRASRRRKTAE